MKASEFAETRCRQSLNIAQTSMLESQLATLEKWVFFALSLCFINLNQDAIHINSPSKEEHVITISIDADLTTVIGDACKAVDAQLPK